MAGRPPLRIGQHGKITRVEIDKGVWVARCRYRDADGVTRLVERRSPGVDQHGKKAEDALVESLKSRRPPGVSGDVSLDTTLSELVEQHLTVLQGKKSPATMTTYRSTQRTLRKFSESMRVGEALPGRVNAILQSVREAHGAGVARHCRTLLKGALQIAVLDNVLPANPVLQTDAIESTTETVGAPAIDKFTLRELFARLRASEYCQQADLVDPITVFIATGFRRSEVLALRWVDFNTETGELTSSGKVVRETGKGLKRYEKGKTKSALRTVKLPGFAYAALIDRRASRADWRGELEMIFPSTAGSWRDPDNFNKQWRKVREELGVPDVTSHSFRKSMATAIDDAGMSARIGADQLGHSKVSLTQDKYMKRGKIHPEVADLMDLIISGD